MRGGLALPYSLLGSSLWLQAHLALGFLVAEAARDLLERAAGWTVLALGAVGRGIYGALGKF